jgi:hypothetical protein
MSTRFVVVLLLAGLPSLLRAQENEVNLTAVRGKTDLTEEDRGLIRTFVSQRITKITGGEPADARQAADELRAAYDGTDPFKRDYGLACLEMISSAYKKAELAPATRLLTILNIFSMVEAQNVFLEALQDDRVGVRAAGAVGLRGLRPKLASAGRDVFVKVLDGLKEAGKREKSRDTLKTIYAAMNYFELPSSPDAKANLTALLDLLEARTRQYAAGTVAAAGADDVGLRMVQAAIKNMDEAERQRLTVVAATMMKYAIEQYTSPATKLSEVRDKTASREMIEARNAMERLILVSEDLLANSLVKPDKSPAVAENMRKLNTIDMKNEWQKKWVPLLQRAVNQDFTLKEAPEGEEGAGG